MTMSRTATILLLILFLTICGLMVLTLTLGGFLVVDTAEKLPDDAIPAAALTPVRPGQPQVADSSAHLDVNRLLVLGDDGNIETMLPDGSDRRAVTYGAGVQRIFRQPSWSPDARRIAWAEIDTTGAVPKTALVTSELQSGAMTRADSAASPPFYIYWSPDSQRLAYLCNLDLSMALRLVNLSSGASSSATLAVGQPFYFSWSPDGTQMLAHTGADQLGFIRLDGQRQVIPRRPGTFAAPEWSPDGQALLFAVHEGEDQQLVLADPTGALRQPLVTYDGSISFALSPDGKKLAYVVTQIPIPTAAFGSLRVVDLVSGDESTVTPNPVLGFFWSPDSQSLAYLVPGESGPGNPLAARPSPQRDHDDVWLRWIVWNGEKNLELGRFVPSEDFLVDFLRYFDQYARSMTLWAPDSSAFVYAGRSQHGVEGIWVQGVREDANPVWVAGGSFASWSPR